MCLVCLPLRSPLLSCIVVMQICRYMCIYIYMFVNGVDNAQSIILTHKTRHNICHTMQTGREGHGKIRHASLMANGHYVSSITAVSSNVMVMANRWKIVSQKMFNCLISNFQCGDEYLGHGHDALQSVALTALTSHRACKRHHSLCELDVH